MLATTRLGQAVLDGNHLTSDALSVEDREMLRRLLTRLDS
jgi:hypothetical protein